MIGSLLTDNTHIMDIFGDDRVGMDWNVSLFKLCIGQDQGCYLEDLNISAILSVSDVIFYTQIDVIYFYCSPSSYPTCYITSQIARNLPVPLFAVWEMVHCSVVWRVFFKTPPFHPPPLPRAQ